MVTNKRTDKDKRLTIKTGMVEKTVAAIVCKDNHDKYKILEDALVQSRFWNCLEKCRISLDKPASTLRIAIKPDLELFDVLSSTGTDPRLVEHLIALLYLKGYRQVMVVDSIGSSDLWLENRDVEVLADLVGYRYKTDNGDSYSVVTLSNDLIDAGFGAGSILAGSQLGRAWVDADFRISMAKNKTDQEYGYSLGLNSILGVLPLRDREYHYYHRFEPGDVCAELLRRTPVHFSIIDAIVSNHGSSGSFKPNPLQTDTIIASENIILCDFVGAMKMGLDPYTSRVNAGVMRSIGLPKQYTIKGDLGPYSGWANVSALLSYSVRRRNEYLPAHQMARAWFQAVNTDVFPFKSYVDERINKTLTRLSGEIDSHPLGLIGATGLNYLVGWCYQAMRAYQVLYDKEQIARRQTSLGIDLTKYTAEDYYEIINYLETLAQIVEKTPPDHNGLRWRYLDQSVIFEYKRILPIEFNSFVNNVDISAAVRMMNDNIGGALEVVKRNRAGKVILQAERNIYLPQPNWMVIFKGDFIDVGKLELVRYARNRQQIFWRTVTSANRSATYDDGIVTFATSPTNGTEITVVARQEFTLPLFWQIFNVDYVPQVKNALVSDSYTAFFSRTLANYEAAYEGRNVGTGKQWDKKAGEADSDKPHMPVEHLVDTILKVFEMAQPLIRTFKENRNTSPTGPSESNGREPSRDKTFRTVINSLGETGQIFFADLYEAIKKDISQMGRKTDRDNR